LDWYPANEYILRGQNPINPITQEYQNRYN
jgi:hypothetical protein